MMRRTGGNVNACDVCTHARRHAPADAVEVEARQHGGRLLEGALGLEHLEELRPEHVVLHCNCDLGLFERRA